MSFEWAELMELDSVTEIHKDNQQAAGRSCHDQLAELAPLALASQLKWMGRRQTAANWGKQKQLTFSSGNKLIQLNNDEYDDWYRRN